MDLSSALARARKAVAMLDPLGTAAQKARRVAKSLAPAGRVFTHHSERPFLSVAKVGDSAWYISGVVLEPGEAYSADMIRDAECSWMAGYRVTRKGLVNRNVRIGQSLIAPVDMTIAGQRVRKGSWILGCIVEDANLVARVQRGEITGFTSTGVGFSPPGC